MDMGGMPMGMRLVVLLRMERGMSNIPVAPGRLVIAMITPVAERADRPETAETVTWQVREVAMASPLDLVAAAGTPGIFMAVAVEHIQPVHKAGSD